MPLPIMSQRIPLLPLVILVVVSPLCLLAFPARAAEDDASRVPNFAFATQLGSGVYDVDGRTVQIYRFGPSFQLRSLEGRKWGLRLRFPVTLGFYNFTIADVITEGLPSRLNTVALVPSVEVPVIVADDWFLTPFGGVGIAKDLGVGTSTFIYATGVGSLALFQLGKQDIRLGNRFVYTGYTTRRFDFEDDFILLETGLDVQRPTGIRLWQQELATSLFGVNYLYVVSPQLIQQIEESLRLDTNWELGFTLGTVEPWKVLGVRFPRLGLSYRFGGNTTALRFIIGNPFPLDPPVRRSGEG